jgi:glycosyltransferase involved in cell wall biosynthesis
VLLLKIGHVTFNYKPIVGGAETYLSNLIDVFHAAGHEQTVYQRDNGVQSEELCLVPRMPKFIPKQIAFNLGLPLKLNRLMKEDLLIVNYPEHYFPVVWHKNVVVLTHGVNWTSETNPRKKKIRKSSAQYAFNKAKKFVANDTFFLRQMGMDIDPRTHMFEEVKQGVWFIPNCVNTDYFSRNEGVEELRALHPIVVPRNFTHPRGIDLAVKAFHEFNKVYPETTLVLVGDVIPGMASSIQFKDEIVQLVEKLGLKQKVRFYGNVNWKDMPGVFSSAELTLIPTRCGEGTSLSALESMSCGTATITTAVEGLLDLPGEKCEPTVEAIAEAMIDAYPRREELAKTQCEMVRNTYNMENWSKAWLEVINR